ncbi:hypothetical protein [Candidatus Nitrosocosmicus sp. SS]|uniref:hypothetical protein n=1 Tax=Candidatus Nitrosocosmicus agrestis TaxID=2563600 RepID=UPI00122E9129|nr:hypothetical protein [Candidatus Nitrosocosmicus sp. SS]KAA2280363.1 hypothetical protein F1Z66_11250 [Candidatus Nitrosocosmicus sp. SS]KAF0868039.1 hypothetical protein E5N71_12250 [Candidatus Nitrosocosmicus sp. SS]
MSMITNKSKLLLTICFVGAATCLLINMISSTVFVADATTNIKCVKPFKDLITPRGIVCFLPKSSSLPDAPPQISK